jgi:tetratricopeptide (TPR) repeat protein
MKLIGILVVTLATAAMAQSPAGSAPSPSTPGSQPATASGTAPAAAPATPAGRHPLQAKTQPEYEAYNTAHALAKDPAAADAAAVEKAANDFATKFPDSELKVLLYRDAMHVYQSSNNADKMLEMGRQVLKLDPNDPEAMIGVAEVLTERTRDTDIDKDQRLAEATQLAQHALETIDTNIVVPSGAPPEQVEGYKQFLRSSAYAIIGTQQYNKEDYKGAEGAFRKSIDAFASQPDPIVVLRLALALDKQQKYAEALKEVNKAVDLTASQTDSSVGTYARQERDRLVQLTGGTAPAPAPKSTATPPSTPKN